MNEFPLVSVIIPVYNPKSDDFDLALESIIKQTLSNLEIVIINDGSSNGWFFDSEKYIDPRIVFINLETNQGISNALNVGISRSRGKYIARMDSDDISKLNRLDYQVNLMMSHNIISNSVIVIDDKNNTIGKSKNLLFHNFIRRFQLYFLKQNPVNHPTIMAKREIFDSFNYDSEFDGVEDLNLWLEMRKKYKIYFDKEYLLYYRDYKSNKSPKTEKINRIKMKYSLMFEFLTFISNKFRMK